MILKTLEAILSKQDEGFIERMMADYFFDEVNSENNFSNVMFFW